VEAARFEIFAATKIQGEDVGSLVLRNVGIIPHQCSVS